MLSHVISVMKATSLATSFSWN